MISKININTPSIKQKQTSFKGSITATALEKTEKNMESYAESILTKLKEMRIGANIIDKNYDGEAMFINVEYKVKPYIKIGFPKCDNSIAKKIFPKLKEEFAALELTFSKFK